MIMNFALGKLNSGMLLMLCCLPEGQESRLPGAGTKRLPQPTGCSEAQEGVACLLQGLQVASFGSSEALLLSSSHRGTRLRASG